MTESKMKYFTAFILALMLLLTFTACGDEISDAGPDDISHKLDGPTPIPTQTPTPTPSLTPSPTPSPFALPDEVALPGIDFEINISRLDGSTATIPLVQAGLTALLGNADGLVHNKTDMAYRLLFEGEKDVIFVTYPSEEELAVAKERGIELEIVPVVKDALVFLANAENNVANLTSEQIQGIYTGKITNWTSLGGDNAEIIPFQRPTNSGSQTLFLKLAMPGKTPIDAPDTFKPIEMGGLVDAVANYDNGKYALGFSLFYYATEMYLRDAVKLMAVNGVMPSTQTISSGEYEYLTYYYAVYDKDLPPDAAARKLVAWFLSEEGQRVALAAGYVPLAPIAGTSDNLVYGYYGSTPENTTKSSGTGGKEFIGVSDNEALRRYSKNGGMTWDIDENTHRIVNLYIPGYPEATEAISAWFLNSLPDNWVYQDIRGCGSLINVSTSVYKYRRNFYEELQECAVFDAKTGQQLALADLFYDGANYIDFINKNLLAEAALSSPGLVETELWDIWNSFDEKWLIRPFTGIPADYSKFQILCNDYGVYLTILFDSDNPFFLIDDDYTAPSIYLPADLSPYAQFWKITPKIMQPVPQMRVAVPQMVSTYLSPSAKDKKINVAIMKAYEQAVKAGVFAAYVERGGSRDDGIYIWNIETSVGDGYLTVVFSSLPYDRFGRWKGEVVSKVTFDLATGEAVDTPPLAQQ